MQFVKIYTLYALEVGFTSAISPTCHSKAYSKTVTALSIQYTLQVY